MEIFESGKLKAKGLETEISPDGRYRYYGSNNLSLNDGRNKYLQGSYLSPGCRNRHELFPYRTKMGKSYLTKDKDSSGSEDGRTTMPANQDLSSGPRAKSAGGQRPINRKLMNDKTQENANDMKKTQKNPRIASGRKLKRTPKATELTSNEDLQNQIQRPVKIETANPESKLLMFLAENLQEYSRQRLRAVHMSLRHYSNVEARVTQKELIQAFQDNYVKLSGRIQQFLIEKFEDQHGIDAEKLYRYLMEAHSKSGRDSVMATQCRNGPQTRTELPPEERDNDLLFRLEALLINDKAYFDLPALRDALQGRDRTKMGKVEKFEILDIISRLQVPLYGSLLKSLIKRCDDERNELISWPEFLSFLEKSQHNAWNKCPELSELPEKLKAKTPVIPDPIDELSETTKTKLVNRLLLKKASLNKVDKSKDSHKVNQNNNVVKKDVIQTTTEECKEEDTKVAETTNKQKQTKNGGNQGNDKTAKSDQSANDTKSMQKVSGLVKTSSGFLSSMKNLISGKKKTEVDENSQNSESKQPDSQKEPEKPTENKKPEFEIGAPSTKPPDVKQNENTEPKLADENSTKVETSTNVTKSTDGNQIEFRVRGHTVTLNKPTDFPEDEVKLDPPEERLKLDWVYGYRGNDCRTNIHIISSNEIVYFISNIVVIYNRTEHKQRHYREHTEDIKCLAVHPEGSIIASGQFTDRHKPHNMAHIRVWRTDNLQTINVFGSGQFQKAVMCVAFAKEGNFLVATDNSREKKLMVWNIENCQLLGETMLDTEVMCDLSFNTKYPDILVTTGKEHLTWWKIYPESNTVQLSAQPDYENYLKAKFIICLTHNERGDLITGDSNGTIYIWGDGGNKITNFIKHGHDGPVFTLLCSKNQLLSGGRDGIINSWTWNKNMDLAESLTIPKSEGGVRMLQIHNESLLIGTTMNSLLSANKQNSNSSELELDSIPITQGHYDELRGLVKVNESDISADFITAGLDGIICWFNTGRRDPVCKLVLKGMQFVCVDWYSSTKLLCLGTKDGHLIILEINGESSNEVLNQKICKDRINTVKVSADGNRIAAGSHDNCVYIYELKTKDDGTVTWECLGKLKGHGAPVYCLDWSSDKFNEEFIIRSCSSNNEEILWSATSLEQLTEPVPYEMKWRSNNCRLDYTLFGLWLSKQAQDSEIICVDVNKSGNLVALGDNNGYISLFRYPCPKKGVYCHTYRSHYSVQNVQFTGDYVITVGGRDSSILQWKLI